MRGLSSLHTTLVSSSEQPGVLEKSNGKSCEEFQSEVNYVLVKSVLAANTAIASNKNR